MKNEFKYKLSIIIVNYNVEYFLNQCLTSVKKAIEGLNCEIIIVDNASADGSVEMLKEKFNEFKLIFNTDNVGFSKANNQAIRVAQGEFILLLNPDTVVAEDTFKKTIDFMDETPDCGGLGTRMIDGRGNFLPESKRGLPTPLVAFYKISGLSKIFPASKKFGQYHLGHLSEFEINEIDILSGAFMMMRAEALEKVGLLDEAFFMYGEDIDLSYRIQKGGYKNYYFPETEIIHYKGESTKKSSVNYVFVFYRAMVIFAKKHFSGNNAWIFSILINLGIYLRASLALLKRFISAIFLPLIDLSILVFGLFALTNYWRMSNIEFPQDLLNYSIPIYSLIWIVSNYINGSYDQPIKLFKFIKPTLIGTITILLMYALLPKSLQFSRLFIILGTVWVLGYYIVSRAFLHLSIKGKFKLTTSEKKSFTIVGSEEEFKRVSLLLRQSTSRIGEIEQSTLINITKNKNEVVFCSSELSFKDIIQTMSNHKAIEFDYKIAPEKENHLIGSNSIDTAGDLYILDLNTLVTPENIRKKRIFDVVFSIGLIVVSPFIIGRFSKKSTFIKNLLKIFLGQKSFIGFSNSSFIKDVRLPKIKQGILNPCDSIDVCDDTLCEKLNLLYARDYSMRKDFFIVWKSWRQLDR